MSATDPQELHLLFPSDPLVPHRCDPHFRPELLAASALGLEASFFDDSVLHQGVPGSPALPDLAGRTVVYRGWMLSGHAYRRLVAAIEGSGARPLTAPQAYDDAHYLPGWYEAVREHTPASAWTPDGDADPRPLLERLPDGAAIVKDYSKSMKHLWEEACFIADVRETESAMSVINRFRELRGSDLHGLVLRHFEPLGAEYRSWWIDGDPRLLSAHPDTPGLLPSDLDLSFLTESVGSLGARFVTVDLAEAGEGWRVVEVGDPMVSDRPRSCEPEEFLRALFRP